MEVLNAKGIVLSIQNYAIANIPNILEPILSKTGFSNYSTKELLKEMEDATNESNNNLRSNYLLWLEDEEIIGYAYLEYIRDSEAFICFKTIKAAVSEEFLQAYLEATIGYWFKEYKLQKILFDANKNSPGELGKLFLKIFRPHPIGWIHLGNSNYILTAEQLHHKGENFYKL